LPIWKVWKGRLKSPFGLSLSRMAAARFDVSRIKPIIKLAISEDELMRLRSSPPFAWGFVSRSPSVAPSRRVRMNASQNNNVWDMFIVKYAAATTANAPAKTSAPPSYPSLVARFSQIDG
jgi:hypothetical protein